MTSRVQKGGPVFRPVTKSRIRPAANALGSQIPQSEVDPQGNNGSSSTLISVTDVTQNPSLTSHESTPEISVQSQSAMALAEDFEIDKYPEGLPPVQSMQGSPLTERILPPTSRDSFAHDLHQVTSPTPTSSPATPIAVPNMVQAPTPNLRTQASRAPLSEQVAQQLDMQPSAHAATVTPKELSTPADADTGQRIKSVDIAPNHSSKPPPTSRKRKREVDSNTQDDAENLPKVQPKQNKKSPSVIPRSRGSHAPSLPPFDASTDPGEDIDPTVTTMAAICSDTGQGRISTKAAEIVSNHAAWKAQNMEKRARMRELMERKKYGRSEDEEEPSRTPFPSPASTSNISTPRTGASREAGTDPDAFDYTQDLATSRYNVQIRIGPNGETVIDEDSLVVDRSEPVNLDEYTHIVESDHTKFVNSGTYGKRFRGARWSAEETERFYEALSQYGENYELIAYVLPGRDRKSCKNKFKAEDKKNHARIEYCLRNTIPMDVKTLSRMTGKDFSGPVPEIRLPAQLPPPPPQEKEPTMPLPFHSKSRKYSMSTEPELILGSIDDFDS